MIKVGELYSALIQLAHKSGEFAQSIFEQGHVKESTGHSDPITQAKISALIMIHSTLDKYFRGIKVISMQNFPPNPTNAIELEIKDLVDESLLPFPQVRFDQVIVWVNPMDGSASFVAGETEGITSMLGISIAGRPMFGVIHHPFHPEQVTYWGGTGLPLHVTTNSSDSMGTEVKTSDKEPKYTALTSKFNVTPFIKNYLEKLPFEIQKCTGTGHTINLIALNEHAIHIYPSKGECYKWDTCACEAVLASVGGVLVDMHGQSYLYEEESDYANGFGIIATRNRSHIQNAVEVFAEYMQELRETIYMGNN